MSELILKFKCPDCQGSELDEVCSNAFITTPITVTDNGDHGEIGEVKVHDAYPERFQCQHCGYILQDKKGVTITTVEKVAEWIKDNVYL